MGTRICVALLLVLFGGTTFSYGGWLDSTLEGVGKRITNRAINDAGDSAYDAIDDDTSASESKKPATEKRRPQKSSSSQPAKQSRQDVEADSATVADGATIEDAEKIYSKFDFIPGDKVIFFDDFSDTDVGEFPRKWTLDGPKQGNNNTVEVVEFQGKKFLRSVPAAKGKRQHTATQYLRLNQKGDLPEKFTIEFDAVLGENQPGRGGHGRKTYTLLLPKGDKFPWGGNEKGGFRFTDREARSVGTQTSIDMNDNKVHHIAISVNGTFVKGYVDNMRVINDPDGIDRPVKRVGIYMDTWEQGSENLMFTNFRLAEGGKDIKSALDTDGKIITHGILFDTGKAILKAESLPTLKMILGLLNDDPELRFSIEGHTDNQGGKGVNQPLSEKRAAAVKQWLEGKGIEGNRLKASGFGDSKPIDSNKTPEGRANNRRVEFVKF